jgi:CHRD domain
MDLRRKLATGTAVVAVAGLASIAGVVSAQGRPLSTDLNGAEEAPGPGDPNATGNAELTLNQGQGEVCFDLSWAQVDGTVFAAHIHVGEAGSPGPVVVTLFTGTFAGTDEASGCVSDVDPELIKAIRQNPSAYYVNVHSDVFPGGAVRGQLGD